MLRRPPLAALFALTVTVAGLVVPDSPAAAAPLTSTAPRTGWAYTDAQRPTVTYLDPAGDTPVGTWHDAEGTDHRSRSYFTYDLSRYQGQVVHRATLSIAETAVEDCSRAVPVELWVTGPITSDTTWQNAPAELSLTSTVSMGGEQQCPAGDHAFDLTSAVNAAVADGQTRITLGLRVTVTEESHGWSGRFLRTKSLSVTANTPPRTPYDLRVPSRTSGCGTRDNPIYVGGNPTFYARFDDADNDVLRPTFAWWPVDDEAARREVTITASPGPATYHEPWQNPIGEGRYAWAARSNDGYDRSEWSAPCYFHVDRHAPPPPTVTSEDYPSGFDPYGGPGITGTFRIEPGADDVVEYVLNDMHRVWTVPAPEMGAGITVEITPRKYGTNFLSVWSYDRTGIRSRQTTYSYSVRRTSPEVRIEMGGVGLPSRMTMTPGVAGVTEYRYRIGTGPEVSVPAAADGTGFAGFSFPAKGSTEVAVSNYTADGLAGTWYDTIWVTDAPKVTSSSRDPDTGEIVGLVGEPLALTLNPGRPGVVRYEYTIESETASVAAGADGSATINWTPSYEGRPDISVVSVQADGSYSESSSTTIQVTDPRPFVSAFDYNPYYPTGGAGVTDTFLFETRMTGVVEFVVRLNGGEEIVVPASGGQGTQVLTPDRAGENVVSAQSRFADGSLSPAREWTFLVAG